jgi:tryptophan synthase alpha chain
MVSSAECYRITNRFWKAQEDYFKRIADMNLKNPSNRIWNQQQRNFEQAKPQFAKGAIIGSAFIQDLTKNGTEKLTLSLMPFDKLFYISRKRCLNEI